MSKLIWDSAPQRIANLAGGKPWIASEPKRSNVISPNLAVVKNAILVMAVISRPIEVERDNLAREIPWFDNSQNDSACAAGMRSV